MPESHPVSAAFANGIGSGGQGYNTRRPFEIAFLIDLAIAWKKLPQDRQVEVAADPWLFQEVVDSIEDAESKQLIAQLLASVWAHGFVEAARHGLPALRREVATKGATVRGRLDVPASLRLIASGGGQVVSTSLTLTTLAGAAVALGQRIKLELTPV